MGIENGTIGLFLEGKKVVGEQAAVVAALTENSTTIGGTQDSNFATLSVAWNGSTDPTAAEGTLLIDAIREIAAKVNVILAKLKTHGLIASS